MNCLDCSTESRISKAVGVCTTCGAGVCTSHLELDTHVAAPFAGVGSRREYATRAVTCPNPDHVRVRTTWYLLPT